MHNLQLYLIKGKTEWLSVQMPQRAITMPHKYPNCHNYTDKGKRFHRLKNALNSYISLPINK